MMARRFIALDNAPGVNPVGIREIIRHLRSKYFLLVKCTKAMEACKNINLYIVSILMMQDITRGESLIMLFIITTNPTTFSYRTSDRYC